MHELQEAAIYAAQHRIRGRSYKRNSLLKPLDFILDELERCPDPTNKNEIAFARTSSKGLIAEHVRRIASRVREQAIYDYVDLFFDGVLQGAHHGNVNMLLQRERSLRSAYLVYMRQELAKIFAERGKARDVSTAMQELEKGEDENDSDTDF